MLSCSMVTTSDCPAAAVLSVVLCGTVPCRVVLCCAVLPPCCADQIRRPSNWNAAEAIGLGPVTPDPTIDTTGTADGFCWGGGVLQVDTFTTERYSLRFVMNHGLVLLSNAMHGQTYVADVNIGVECRVCWQGTSPTRPCGRGGGGRGV